MSRSASVSGGILRACHGDPRALLLGIALLGTLASAVHGGIALISQDRFVDVTTAGVPGPPLLPADQRVDAPDFGPFDRSVNLDYPPGTSQTVSQNSTLTLTPDGLGAVFDAHGLLFHSASQNGLSGTAHFQVDFSVSEATPYFLTYNGREGDPRFGNLDTFVAGAFSGPSAPGTLAGDPITTNFFTVLTYSGTLQPGSYELLAEVKTIGFASFDANLAIGTAAVPLPAALWEVLSALPVVLLGLWVATQKSKTVRRYAWFTRRR